MAMHFRCLGFLRLKRPSFSKFRHLPTLGHSRSLSASANSQTTKDSMFDPDRLNKSRRFEQIPAATATASTSALASALKSPSASSLTYNTTISEMKDLNKLVYEPRHQGHILVVTQDNCKGCDLIKPVYADYLPKFSSRLHMMNLTEFAKVNKKSSVQYLKQCFGITIKEVPSLFFLLPTNVDRITYMIEPTLDDVTLFGDRNNLFWRHCKTSPDRFSHQVENFFKITQ